MTVYLADQSSDSSKTASGYLNLKLMCVRSVHLKLMWLTDWEVERQSTGDWADWLLGQGQPGAGENFRVIYLQS